MLLKLGIGRRVLLTGTTSHVEWTVTRGWAVLTIAGWLKFFDSYCLREGACWRSVAHREIYWRPWNRR